MKGDMQKAIYYYEKMTKIKEINSYTVLDLSAKSAKNSQLLEYLFAKDNCTPPFVSLLDFAPNIDQVTRYFKDYESRGLLTREYYTSYFLRLRSSNRHDQAKKIAEEATAKYYLTEEAFLEGANSRATDLLGAHKFFIGEIQVMVKN
eukprot:TRINITY_DN9872_c0_g1_i1.p1 TRINITY_DN9872_c0_g1~~TRINITY_DN9872_c0_g1_i1.p1  ORF type:complete len:147 (-),score=11.48 TRINITY_DN9872_c0_g1_i1:86-526(-)